MTKTILITLKITRRSVIKYSVLIVSVCKQNNYAKLLSVDFLEKPVDIRYDTYERFSLKILFTALKCTSGGNTRSLVVYIYIYIFFFFHSCNNLIEKANNRYMQVYQVHIIKPISTIWYKLMPCYLSISIHIAWSTARAISSSLLIDFQYWISLEWFSLWNLEGARGPHLINSLRLKM